MSKYEILNKIIKNENLHKNEMMCCPILVYYRKRDHRNTHSEFGAIQKNYKNKSLIEPFE